jgi:hypothetical protein
MAKSFINFITRPKSNQGVKLTIPDTEGETITVIGVDSDKFKQTSIELVRASAKAAEGKDLTDKQIDKVAADNRIALLTACVVDWSFSEKCTPANVKKLLIDAPQIALFIDVEAGNQSNFLGKP